MQKLILNTETGSKVEISIITVAKIKGKNCVLYGFKDEQGLLDIRASYVVKDESGLDSFKVIVDENVQLDIMEYISNCLETNRSMEIVKEIFIREMQIRLLYLMEHPDELKISEDNDEHYELNIEMTDLPDCLLRDMDKIMVRGWIFEYQDRYPDYEYVYSSNCEIHMEEDLCKSVTLFLNKYSFDMSVEELHENRELEKSAEEAFIKEMHIQLLDKLEHPEELTISENEENYSFEIKNLPECILKYIDEVFIMNCILEYKEKYPEYRNIYSVENEIHTEEDLCKSVTLSLNKYFFDKSVNELRKNREIVKEVPVEVIKEVVKEVPVEVIKEVIKEVPVERNKDVYIEMYKGVYNIDTYRWMRTTCHAGYYNVDTILRISESHGEIGYSLTFTDGNTYYTDTEYAKKIYEAKGIPFRG